MLDTDNNVAKEDTEEAIYQLDYDSIWSMFRRSVFNLILIAMALLLILAPLLISKPANSAAALPGVLILIATSFSLVLALYGRYMHNAARLRISSTGVRLENPFYTVETPWANILRIGPADIRTGDSRGDVVAAQLKAGQNALLLRYSVARRFRKADRVGEFLRPLMRPDAIRQQNYIAIGQFLHSSQGSALLRDLQRYAPYLQTSVGAR